MATHDYIISNASGAAVRADLNNALAAIVSNNSNASSPSTTYAYQWWADTTTGQLKLRNSANNAWITIFELDGTMLMEDGTLAAPGLAFASDLDTGFSRSAANKINFSTGGAERLEIGSTEVVFNDPSNDVDFRVESNGQSHMLFVDGGNDRVGIGTSSPSGLLHLSGNTCQMHFTDEDDSASSRIYQSGATFAIDIDQANAKASSVFQIRVDDSEAARIDSSGRLLVGTTTEGAALADNLTVADSGHSGITIRSGTANLGSIYFSDGDSGGLGEYAGFVEYNHNGDYLGFGTGSATRLRIDSSGNVLVAVSNTTKTSEGFRIENGGQPNITRGTDGTFISFYHTSGSVIGSIQNNGGTGTLFNTSSDYRLKENVVDIADGITRVKQLSPKRFNFIADDIKIVDGFIAHEAQTVVPEAVTGTKDEVDADGNAVMQGIDQSKLVPLLTAALQEAITKIETLETKVAALEAG